MMNKWPRRAIIGSGSVAGLAGLAGLAYSAAPAFWSQFSREWNREVVPPSAVPRPDRWPDTGLHAAWLGHATVLLKIDGFTLLTDPVLSTRVGINLIGDVTLGLKRLVEPALHLQDFPKVDLVLLSHAHMDHFDIPTLRALERKDLPVVTAPATSDLLRPNRYQKVQELRWDERIRMGPVSLRAFQVNHWGARMRSDTYRGYNGYTIEAGRYRVLFAGDSADTGLFRNVKGGADFDLAIMPIGAYNPWIRYHCTPEQAWRMGNEASAGRFLPIHHQTFSLGREPYLEPIERFLTIAGNQQDRVVLRRIGEEVHIA